MDQSTNWNQIFGSNNTYEGMLKILHSHTGISWYTRLEQRDPDSQPYLQRVPSLAFRSFRVYLNRLWLEFEIIFLIITDEGWLNRSVKSAPWYSFSDSPTLRVFCLRFLILLFANVTDFKIAVLLYRRQKTIEDGETLYKSADWQHFKSFYSHTWQQRLKPNNKLEKISWHIHSGNFFFEMATHQ